MSKFIKEWQKGEKIKSIDKPALFQAYPKEHHTVQMTNNGFKMASFMGPGTRILQRIKEGNDIPVSLSDGVAKNHDIDYALANNIEDTTERVKKIHEADLEMIRQMDILDKSKADYQFNIRQGKDLIALKIKLENLGVLGKEFFSGGKYMKLTDEDKQMLENARNNLQGGYLGKQSKWSRALKIWRKGIKRGSKAIPKKGSQEYLKILRIAKKLDKRGKKKKGKKELKKIVEEKEKAINGAEASGEKKLNDDLERYYKSLFIKPSVYESRESDKYDIKKKEKPKDKPKDKPKEKPTEEKKEKEEKEEKDDDGDLRTNTQKQIDVDNLIKNTKSTAKDETKQINRQIGSLRTSITTAKTAIKKMKNALPEQIIKKNVKKNELSEYIEEQEIIKSDDLDKLILQLMSLEDDIKETMIKNTALIEKLTLKNETIIEEIKENEKFLNEQKMDDEDVKIKREKISDLKNSINENNETMLEQALLVEILNSNYIDLSTEYKLLKKKFDEQTNQSKGAKEFITKKIKAKEAEIIKLDNKIEKLKKDIIEKEESIPINEKKILQLQGTTNLKIYLKDFLKIRMSLVDDLELKKISSDDALKEILISEDLYNKYKNNKLSDREKKTILDRLKIATPKDYKRQVLTLIHPDKNFGFPVASDIILKIINEIKLKLII